MGWILRSGRNRLAAGCVVLAVLAGAAGDDGRSAASRLAAAAEPSSATVSGAGDSAADAAARVETARLREERSRYAALSARAAADDAAADLFRDLRKFAPGTAEETADVLDDNARALEGSLAEAETEAEAELERLSGEWASVRGGLGAGQRRLAAAFAAREAVGRRPRMLWPLAALPFLLLAALTLRAFWFDLLRVRRIGRPRVHALRPLLVGLSAAAATSAVAVTACGALEWRERRADPRPPLAATAAQLAAEAAEVESGLPALRQDVVEAERQALAASTGRRAKMEQLFDTLPPIYGRWGAIRRQVVRLQGTEAGIAAASAGIAADAADAAAVRAALAAELQATATPLRRFGIERAVGGGALAALLLVGAAGAALGVTLRRRTVAAECPRCFAMGHLRETRTKMQGRKAAVAWVRCGAPWRRTDERTSGTP